MGENIMFDFATEFAQNNPEIAAANDFKVSSQVSKDFKEYVLNQDFEYKTATQEHLESVLETAEKEGYDAKINGEYEALLKVLSASKEEDLDLFEAQIKTLLSNEKIGRASCREGV